MAHHLPSLGTRRTESHPIGHGIEPAFQHLQQRLACHFLRARRKLVGIAELALQHSVNTADLLLFAQLCTVVGAAQILLSMLARRIRTALDGTLVAETFFAF